MRQAPNWAGGARLRRRALWPWPLPPLPPVAAGILGVGDVECVEQADDHLPGRLGGQADDVGDLGVGLAQGLREARDVRLRPVCTFT